MDEILLFSGRIRIDKETSAKRPARPTLKFYSIRILTTNKRNYIVYKELWSVRLGTAQQKL